VSVHRNHRPTIDALESRDLLSLTNQLLSINYYRDILGRAAFSTEVTNWSLALDGGAAPAAVAGAFVSSPEYANSFVDGYFQSYLMRRADPSGLASLAGALVRHRLTPEGLRATILGSDEYFQKSGGSVGDHGASYVKDLYESVLGRPADDGGLASWEAALAGGQSRSQVAFGIINSREGLSRTVNSLYVTYLARAADSAGLAKWVLTIQQAGGTTFNVMAGILGSFEYTGRVTTVLPNDSTISPKVMLVVYDPIMDNFGGKRMHQVYGNDPVTIANGVVADLKADSHGIVNYNIVETDILDAYPYQQDGFQYDNVSFAAARASNQWHQGSHFDYNRFISENGIAQKIDSGAIDEVWLFTGDTDGFKTWESTMAGPNAYFVNSAPVQGVNTTRDFIIMGWNFERGVGEAIHSYGHRTEDIMKHAYDGVWDQNNPVNNWSKFALIDKNNPGQGGVGDTHFPVNGLTDYDYFDSRIVLSNAPDWAYYPYFKGTTETVNNVAWSPDGSDPQRQYLNWFYSWIPHFAGRGPDGRLTDWWIYITNTDFK